MAQARAARRIEPSELTGKIAARRSLRDARSVSSRVATNPGAGPCPDRNEIQSSSKSRKVLSVSSDVVATGPNPAASKHALEAPRIRVSEPHCLIKRYGRGGDLPRHVPEVAEQPHPLGVVPDVGGDGAGLGDDARLLVERRDRVRRKLRTSPEAATS